MVRFGSAFGSAFGSGRFRPVPKLNGSVRFGSAGSVRFLIPSCYVHLVTDLCKAAVLTRVLVPPMLGWVGHRDPFSFLPFLALKIAVVVLIGRGEDVGSPHRAQNLSIRAFRAQIVQFELFEFVLFLKLDKQLLVGRFEASRAIRGSSISVSSALPAS